MNVKRYIAEDMSEAIDKIRGELGRDAFILNSRKIKRKGFFGFFKKPLVEVVAACDDKEDRRAARGNQKLSKITNTYEEATIVPETQIYDRSARLYSPKAEEEPAGPKKQEVRETKVGFLDGDEKIKTIETKIDNINTTINNIVSKMQLNKADYRSVYTPEVERLLLNLIESEIHEEFAHKIAREVNDITARQEAAPEEVMEQILKQYMGEPAPIKLKRFKRTVVLFAGPTGVGKTTTLAKLAAIYSLNHHARVGMITTDTYRIAAVEQLKTYAEILDIPLSVVYSPEEIIDALKEHEDKDIVMIDTAGKSPSDRTLEAEIMELVKYSDADEVHLVMSATTSFTSCLNIINTYSFLRDYKLLFTKMDEIPAWGMLINTRFLTDKPISYTAMGQNVPDDIEVANVKKITGRLIGRDS